MSVKLTRNILLLLIVILLANCKETSQVNAEFVVAKFRESTDSIRKLEFYTHRIDTFPQAGAVWDHTGFALIERDSSDKTFGFSFYGRRDDVKEEYIYDQGVGFEVSDSARTYRTLNWGFGFMGSPGGQMIPQNLFQLDTVYTKRTLIETEKTYILKYEYKDDTIYNVTEILKTVELTKDKFLPVRVTRTARALGNRTFGQTVLSDVRINGEVQNSIQRYKDEFKDYEVVQPEQTLPNPLVGKKLPSISLPDLLDEGRTSEVAMNKVMLIDFWETWCGPCIASMPKVESLKTKFASQLHVVGIVTGDHENAVKLVKKKGISFLNLAGNKAVTEQFGVNSWPRYFLVDKDMIVQKEYMGFSDQIEKDIVAAIRNSN